MPLSVLRGKTHRWRRKDRLLAVALQVFEDNQCACGHPLSDWGGEVAAEIETQTCPWCAAIEKHQQDQERPTPGEKVYVVDGAPFVDDEEAPVFG